uniref:Uncharacterized protein n=1 Tax=Arundo donax TaxID=35708 RepID=A0A0A9U165_ARUDO
MTGIKYFRKKKRQQGLLSDNSQAKGVRSG